LPELNTIAQVWITLVIYGLWWFKPQGIAEVIEIDFSHCQQYQEQLGGNGMTWSTRLLDPTPMEHWAPKGGDHVSLVMVQIVSAIYIVIDALGWTAYFPSHVERIMWNVAVCICAAGSLLLLAARLLFVLAPRGRLHLRMVEFAVGCAVLLGVLGRFVLTIESFVSIRSLPVGAYSTPSWSDFIPHIG